MMPDAELFGDDHVFLRIASNDKAAIKYLHTEQGIKTVVSQAFLGLGLKEGSFDVFANLMWVRWPRDRAFLELEDDFPCIGEHHILPPKSEAHDSDRKKASLPPVPPEVVPVIKRNFYSNAPSN